jgi:putative transposase
VDRNTTGHIAVAGNPTTGKVWKLGKEALYIHNKYRSIRKTLQKKGKYGVVKKVKNRESKIVRNLNHKISYGIIAFAKNNNAGIVLENLKGIRKEKTRHSFKYALNSWSFYQLRQFIEYKAKLHGIPIVTIAPQYTSQQCSRCGLLGERKGKSFKCSCGHVENADVNASFVIALRHIGILQLPVDRDAGKGSTDTPKMATVKNDTDHGTPRL